MRKFGFLGIVKKNKLSFDSNFYSKYNLYENENAKRLIDKIKLINK